jgi:hypothetical protein
VKLADAQAFVLSMGRYEMGMGFATPDELDMEIYGTTGEELRWKHPDLFPREGIEAHDASQKLSRRFVAIDMGFDARMIARMDNANREYMQKIGILIQVLV